MKMSRGTSSVTNYLRSIKSVANELALIGAPLDNLNLVMHTLNGIGSDYKEITVAIRVKDL